MGDGVDGDGDEGPRVSVGGGLRWRFGSLSRCSVCVFKLMLRFGTLFRYTFAVQLRCKPEASSENRNSRLCKVRPLFSRPINA